MSSGRGSLPGRQCGSISSAILVHVRGWHRSFQPSMKFSMAAYRSFHAITVGLDARSAAISFVPSRRPPAARSGRPAARARPDRRRPRPRGEHLTVARRDLHPHSQCHKPWLVKRAHQSKNLAHGPLAIVFAGLCLGVHFIPINRNWGKLLNAGSSSSPNVQAAAFPVLQRHPAQSDICLTNAGISSLGRPCVPRTYDTLAVSYCQRTIPPAVLAAQPCLCPHSTGVSAGMTDRQTGKSRARKL